MQDREIQNGGKLTRPRLAVCSFVNEGKVAEASGRLYTLNTETLPILTYLRTGQSVQSPFKSDVYFFLREFRPTSTGDAKIPSPCATRNSAPSSSRFGIYSYHLSDAKSFYSKISGTRDLYRVADLEGSCATPIIPR